jgi:hypothetical protein
VPRPSFSVVGPIFISHSSEDVKALDLMSTAIQRAMRHQIRIFRTTHMSTGENWRQQVIDGIRASAVMLLLASPRTFSSVEVCFELGVAAALEKRVIPCLIEFNPKELPLGLDEIQAVDLWSSVGWSRLLNDLALISGFHGEVDPDVTDVIDELRGESELLECRALGRTVELRNKGNVTMFDLHASDETGTGPEWLARLRRDLLDPGDAIDVMRAHNEGQMTIEMRWRAHGRPHFRRFDLPTVSR